MGHWGGFAFWWFFMHGLLRVDISLQCSATVLKRKFCIFDSAVFSKAFINVNAKNGMKYQTQF